MWLQTRMFLLVALLFGILYGVITGVGTWMGAGSATFYIGFAVVFLVMVATAFAIWITGKIFVAFENRSVKRLPTETVDEGGAP